jgi:hypothetical protein
VEQLLDQEEEPVVYKEVEVVVIKDFGNVSPLK